MNRTLSNQNYYSPAPKSSHRSPFKGCLLKTLILLIVVGGLYFWLYKPSGRAADIAPAISSFTGEPDIIIKQTGIEKTSYGTVKQYSANLENGDPVYFDIDKKGGVAGFFRAQQQTGEVRISLDQARKIAVNFASTHYPDLSWLTTTEISETLTGTDGSSNRYYQFAWIRNDSQSGAYLPQMLKVEVNAYTGKVDSCSMLNELLTISTIPAIDQETAIQTALTTIPDSANLEVADVTLIVTTIPIYESNGHQALVWSITVIAKPDEFGYVAGAVIFIEAQTGEVLLIDPFV